MRWIFLICHELRSSSELRGYDPSHEGVRLGGKQPKGPGSRTHRQSMHYSAIERQVRAAANTTAPNSSGPDFVMGRR
eukprot:274217-Chlamydomonas_euryale.AAC.1